MPTFDKAIFIAGYVHGYTGTEAKRLVDQATTLIDKETWDKGIRNLYHVAEEAGTFCYTFFKGVAYKK